MKKTTYIILSLACLLGFTACADFLKEESQSEVIPKTTTDFAELLLGSGYPADYTPNISMVFMMDDDVAQFLTYEYTGYDVTDNYAGTTYAIQYFPMYTWQPYMADFDGAGKEIFKTAAATDYAGFYERIMGCNAVLDYIDTAIGTQAERDRTKAEALAVRALYYFWLVNLYGEPYNYDKNALGVPLKLTSDLTEENIPRSTVAQVYEDVIVPDLLEAARLLDPLTLVRKDYHVNQPAIHILLSRVYLYMENYEESIKHVNKALEQGAVLLDMVGSLMAIGTVNTVNGAVSYRPITYTNPEVEWLFGNAPIINVAEYYSGTSPEFRQLWDMENDSRYVAFNLRNDSERNTNTVLISKPVGGSALGMSIRTAEAYLNRAEAYALSGDNGGALADLNYLRRMRIAGYEDVDDLSGQALIDEIRLERRKELCYEGHRWFDLRRYGMPEIKHVYKAEKGGVELVYTLKKEDPMYTLPFPTILINKNTNLKQNPSASIEERGGEQR